MVYEDSDNLGYWVGPDLDAPASTMLTLAAMLSIEEQDDILVAAFCEHEGDPLAAERARWRANYGGLE